MPNGRGDRAALAGAAFEAALVGVSWLLGWWLGRPPFEDLRWSSRDACLGIAATLPLVALFLACDRVPFEPFRKIRRFFDEAVRPMFASSTIAGLAVLSLAAGVGEEVLFRGVIQPLLAHRFGPAVGLIASSLLFGLVHAITPTYVVLAGLIGVYLGLLFMAGDNLLIPIVVHALYDFLALCYLLRRPARPDHGG
jgi:uncharacterized protein